MYKPRLDGSHYDMGYKYGSLLKKAGVSIDSILDLSDEMLEFGKKSMDICLEIYPEVLDEIRGYAKGMGVCYERLGSFVITAGAFPFDAGCTVITYKKDDKVFFARNHDMFTSLKKTSESSLIRPLNDYYHVSQSDSIIGKEDGVNEHGLAVGMSFVAPKEIKPGLNFLVIVKMILEKCKTVKEAIDMLMKTPTSSSHNITLADKNGDMAVVEMCSNHKEVRYPENNYMVATNHFVHKNMIKYDNRPEFNWFYTEDRYKTCVDILSKELIIDLQLGMDIMSMKKGYINQYKKNMKFDTLWSFCVELNTLEIKKAIGNPKRARYQSDPRLVWAIKKR